MGGENSNELKTNVNASNDQGETFRTPFSPVNSDCSTSSRTEWETTLEGSGRGSAKISDSSDNVSSSWSNSSSGEVFRVNLQVLPKSREQNYISKPNEGTKPLHKNGKICAPVEACRRSLEESIGDYPESVSQFSDVTHESFVPHILPTEYPPIQVMERTESFDPNRIPASIFTGPETPMDWSISSNESLFSIHMGNNSFKEHALRMSEDMYRSGELPVSGELSESGKLHLSGEFYRSGQLYQSGEHCKSDERKMSGEVVRLGQTFLAAKGAEPNQNMEKSKDISEGMKPEAKAVTDEPNSNVPEACINIQTGGNLAGSGNPCNANQRSDGNKICFQAFVSSIKKKRAWPLCPCLYCGWMYSCCKWPRCCCKRSSFSCKWCSWPSCSSNCLSWPSCCCKRSGFSCKWCSWPSCSSNCLSWPSCCCKRSGFSCKWFSWPSCCSNCLSWPSCCCNCKWPSCPFNCPTWSSCCFKPNMVKLLL